jgi:predicted dehydrogenase
MKQVVHSLHSKQIQVEEVPVPRCQPNGLLVRTAASFISSGTERGMIARGGVGLLRQAVEQPDLVRLVMRRIRRNGMGQVAAAVRSRLDIPTPLGYSAAGTVMEIGAATVGFCVGDRVACAGAGFAAHAAVNKVPENLCVKIPGEVSFEDAASVALGAIALQGVRISGASVGERVAVIGLGLVGLLTGQILKAAACQVMGVDPDPERVRLALALGFDEAWESSGAALRDRLRCLPGCDAVIVTAATRSRQPVDLAGELGRDRAVVVVVGDVRVDVPRQLYYRKELQIRYSRSYGPGRYDPAYEERSQDYPVGYVRWTEKRNMEAYLGLVLQGRVQVGPLITHRFRVADAAEAYDLIQGRTGAKHLGVILTYPESAAEQIPAPMSVAARRPLQIKTGEQDLRIGWIGAGNFSRAVLLPALRRMEGIHLAGVANLSGMTAKAVARRFGFDYCTADAEQILSDPRIDLVFIATRHHLHAPMVVAALERGKHVFVEKPLCVSVREIEAIRTAYENSAKILAVGFNRRFSGAARECARFLEARRERLSVHYRVNAPPLPPGHWAANATEGHGCIIGEACHFVDFIQFLTGTMPARVEAWPLATSSANAEDNFEARIEMDDGSVAHLSYSTAGASTLPKERIEIHSGGRSAILDDFRKCTLFDARRARAKRWWRQDKGHEAELRALIHAIRQGGPCPIPFESLAATTLATLKIRESLAAGEPKLAHALEMEHPSRTAEVLMGSED